MSYYFGGITEALQNPHCDNSKAFCNQIYTKANAPKEKNLIGLSNASKDLAIKGSHFSMSAVSSTIKRKRKPNGKEVQVPSKKIKERKLRSNDVPIEESRPTLKRQVKQQISDRNDECTNNENSLSGTKPVKKKRKCKTSKDLKETNDYNFKEEIQIQNDKRNSEQEERTVFVGNLPLNITKKDLTTLFRCYGKVESVRLRSAIPSKTGMSKKAAIISQNFHTEKDNINAYVVLDSAENAKKALATNGILLQGHHLRVDLAEKKEYDNSLALFVGNLPFNCQDEELYSFFGRNTEVESVRVVRDRQTGICKGFGFITFKSKDSVELAVQMDEKDFKGRTLRVHRATKQGKKARKPKLGNPRFSGANKSKKGIPFQGNKSSKGVKERKKVQRKIKYANSPNKQMKKVGNGFRTKAFKRQ